MKIAWFLDVALSKQILRFRSGFRLAARTPPGQLKMYYFAIDLGAKMPYHLAPPQGWEAQDRSLKAQQLANSNWQLARVRCMVPGIWDKGLRPSADLGLGLGLGGPWVAQGWPKRRPRATQAPPKG